MPSSDHILCFLLASVLHVLGLLLIGSQSGRLDKQVETAPVLEVASVELNLAMIEPIGPSESATPSEGTAGQQAEEQPIAPLEMPKTEAPPPPPVLPEKPNFADALTPPPEPVHEPAPLPPPLPATAAPPLPAPAPKPTAPAPLPRASAATLRSDSGQAATAPAGGAGDKAEILPAKGGGGASGRIDAHPSLHRPIKPSYPIGSRRRGEEGTVILDVTVAADGSAKAVSLVSTSGFKDLDGAAERAASQARFKPGTRNGKPIESAARITIIFRLRDS